MPKSKITPWYITKTRRIMRDIGALKQTAIADELNESRQTINYRIKNVYPGQVQDFLRILNLAGYEVVEKREEGWQRYY